MLELVKHKPYAFGLESGFTDLSDIHNEWIKQFVLNDNDMTLQAHRGSYKTTCLSIAIALMLIVYPDKNILFVRKTDRDVIEVIAQISKLLDSDIFKKLCKKIHKRELSKTKSTGTEIDTNVKASTRGTSQLLGVGIKGSLTGKHADIVITDDIVNIEDRISKAERNRTKLIYQELQNIKNRGGRFINTGTPWHKEDCFTLMPTVIKYDCYSTNLMDPKQIQDIRNSMTSSLFSANYELKHIADEDSMFNNPQIDTTGEADELIKNGICHIDASYGGKDSTSFTIIKEVGDKIYAYGYLTHKHIDDVLDTIQAKREHYQAGLLYLESNSDKGYLAKKINHTKSYHEKMNKYIKISTYLKERWNDIIFLAGTDKEYIAQILDFTENAEHDDAPDSLSSLLRTIKVRGLKTMNKSHLGL